MKPSPSQSFQNATRPERRRRPSRAALQISATAGLALVGLSGCKLPEMAGFQRESKNLTLASKEALASASTRSFPGEKQWADDFFRPIGRGWSGVAPTKLDENGSVRYAIEHSLSTATGAVEIASADAAQRLARSAFLPKLIAQVDAGQDVDRFPVNADQGDFDFGVGVFLRQEVFSWGANQDRYQSSKLRAAGRRQQLTALRNTTAAAVRVGFANYRSQLSLANAYGQGEAVMASLANTTRERAGAGLESSRSVAEIESRLAEYQSQKAAASANAEATRDELTSLLGSGAPMKFETGASTSLRLPNMGRDALVNDALKNSPELDALSTLADAARGEVSAAKKARLPGVALSAGVQSEHDLNGLDRGPDFRVGATSRWVPMAGGQHRANVELAEAELNRALVKLSHTRRSTISGVNGALDQHAAADKAVDASYRALEHARKSETLSKQAYEADSAELDAVLEAHENVVRSLVQHAENLAAKEIALVRLHHLLGRCADGSRGPKTSLARL